MTTTNDDDKITVPMSERRPMRISKAEWPRIARVSDHDGEVECQANRRWWINVRQHSDGRTLVYGGMSSNWRGERDREGGFLLAPDEARDDETLVRTIRRVAGIIGRDDLAQGCISDLPPSED